MATDDLHSESPASDGWRAALTDRLPPIVRGGLLDPGVRGALALAGVALLAAVVAMLVAWRAGPHPVTASTPAAAEVSRAVAPGPSATPVASSSSIVVSVTGKVRNPGVVTVPAGGRVADAVAKAGGVLPGTDITGLALAQRLTDGQQVVVTGEPGSAPPGPTSSGSGSSGSPPAGAPVNLNTATVDQLDALPGVGPVLAQRIIDYRNQHGGFSSPDQLREVKGLGGKKGDELVALVTV